MAMPAAAELRRLLESLEREGISVVRLICGDDPPVPWTLYPSEDGIFDRRTRCQFYYHTHGQAGHDAGHFHTVRLFADRTAHLAGISIAPDGWPHALFTVNHWVAGDAVQTARDLRHYARQFRLGEDRGDPRLVRFVNLMFRAFATEIGQLQDDKVRAIEDHRRRQPAADPGEDRSLEVPSRLAIDLRASAPAPGSASATGEMAS